MLTFGILFILRTMTKTKTILFFSLFLFAVTALKAQTGTVAAGGNATGPGGSVSYSIGQTDYITESGKPGTVSQGLQQPYEIQVMTGIGVTGINLSATVYPNPTTDVVTLSVQDLSVANMSYAVYDIQGKLIMHDKLSGSSTVISFEGLSKSGYFIKVLSNNSEVKTFKIIKN
ncbi:MAG: hypothetical protein JWP12_3920 [Bacteroidetes bacterium]|nr:hypothetical protein [Bacteroidota bacterium]